MLGDGILSQTLLWPSVQGRTSIKQPSLPPTQRVLVVPAGAEELSLGNLEGFVLEGCLFCFVFKVDFNRLVVRVFLTQARGL